MCYKDDMYSSSMAILLVFLSNDQHKAIKYVHTDLIVYHVGCNITTQAEILPFVVSIESDLAKARERHAHEKSVGGAHSYSLLGGNYGGMMALPTELPYCLVYPTIYGDEAEDQTHFNTLVSPSGMCTDVYMCHFLLHLIDKDPTNRREFEGSHLIIPCSMQYRSLFSQITELCNHQGPLIDANRGEPYPMVVVGNFCLVDIFFIGFPGDSFIFNESDLDKLKKKGFHISTYWEEVTKPASSKEMTHKSPNPKENVQKPSCKVEEPHKTKNKGSATSSTWAPDSTSVSKSSHKMKHSPQAKEQKDKCNHEDMTHPPGPRTDPTATKATNVALRRMAAVPPARKAASAVFP